MGPYPPTPRCGIPCALKLAALQTPAHGPLGGPEDTGGLLGGVGLFLHMGILQD